MARIYKNKPSGGKKQTVMKKTLATKDYVNRVINRKIETKNFEQEKIETSSNTVGIPMFLDTIQAVNNFTGTHTLIGQECENRGVLARLALHNNSTHTVFARVLIMHNKLGVNYTSYRSGTDIFDANGSNPSMTGTLYDITRRINNDRYRVLRDKTYRLGPLNSNNDGGNATYAKMWIPMKGKAKFEETATSPETNNLVALVITARADNDVSLGDVVECTFNTTYYFKDA